MIFILDSNSSLNSYIGFSKVLERSNSYSLISWENRLSTKWLSVSSYPVL